MFEIRESKIFTALFSMSAYNIQQFYTLCHKNGLDDFLKSCENFLPTHLPIHGESILNGVMGNRIHPINGRLKFHSGIDLVGKIDTNKILYATMCGFVKKISNQKGYGLTIMIANDFGFETLYAHCSSVLVSVGERVDCTSPVAIMGDTGYTTGKHLHYEIKFKGRLLDPQTFFYTLK